MCLRARKFVTKIRVIQYKADFRGYFKEFLTRIFTGNLAYIDYIERVK